MRKFPPPVKVRSGWFDVPPGLVPDATPSRTPHSVVSDGDAGTWAEGLHFHMVREAAWAPRPVFLAGGEARALGGSGSRCPGAPGPGRGARVGAAGVKYGFPGQALCGGRGTERSGSLCPHLPHT